MSELFPCTLCGQLPTLQDKKSGNFVLFRYVCLNNKCAGHHGRWYLVKGGAKRVWNSSQQSKSSVIKRYILTEIINNRHARKQS